MRVLVVEDEQELCDKLGQVLRYSGFAVDYAGDGVQAETLAFEEVYDCAVLDLGLPRIDGISVLRSWREGDLKFPVLVLTARNRWSDKLAGFNAGADDFLVKPVDLEEVLLRVRALIRRSAGQASPLLTCGPLSLDTNTSRVTVDGVPIQFTVQEFRILEYLMHHKGQLISREAILEHTYDLGTTTQTSNVVDVLISRIRRKIKIDLIHTVRGQGYRLALRTA